MTGRPRRSPAALLGGLALLGAVLAGCAGDPPASSAELPADVPPVADDPLVAVEDSRFEPEVITVEVGTEVVWSFEGRIAHDAVGEGFDSSLMLTGTFAHRFDEPGTHPYVCTLHPGMEGTVLVVEP